MLRNRHCDACGHAFDDPDARHRVCGACGAESWSNPIPVAVLLQPVRHDGRTGLLVIRRAIEPGAGRLALPGGFVEAHETWQEGAARELLEETGVSIDAAGVQLVGASSTEPNPNRILLFCLAPPLDGTSLAPFEGDGESSERGAVFGDVLEGDAAFAFDLHRKVTAGHLAAGAAADYTQL